MTNQEIVYNVVVESTKKFIEDNNLDHNGISALEVSQILKKDRTNISKELNKLWNAQKLIKVMEYPVLYLAKDSVLSFFAIDYLPDTIAKGCVISDYISKKTVVNETNKLEIDNLVGSKDSIYQQIISIKSAVSYPPYGLHTFISGDPGVGKYDFVRRAMQYAIEQGFKSNEAKLIRFDCQYYTNERSPFVQAFFGTSRRTESVKARKGAIGNSNGGIVFLDNINKLYPEYLELLIDVIESGIYYKEGDAEGKQLDCMIIASTQITDSENEFVIKVAKHFPNNIQLPNYRSRITSEKIELVLNQFAFEARQLKMDIQFSKDILTCFVLYDYPNNLKGIRNEVKSVCARAYHDSKLNKVNSINIGFQHLNIDFLSQKDFYKDNNQVSSVLKYLETDNIFINKYGSSKAIDKIKKLNNVFDDRRTDQFINEFEVDINRLDDVQNFIIESINVLANCSQKQIHALNRAIREEAKEIFFKSVQSETIKHTISDESNIGMGLFIHLSSLISSIEKNEYYLHKGSSSLSENLYFKEYQEAKRVIDTIEKKYNCKISEKEIDFIAIYLKSISNWSTSLKPSILLLSHGKGIGKSICEYIKSTTDIGEEIDYLDCMNDLQINDIIELVIVKSHKLDKGAGVVIIADYEPFLSIADHLRTKEKINCRTISPLSLPLTLEVIDYIDKGYSLNKIAWMLGKDNKPKEESLGEENFIDKLITKFIIPSVSFIDVRKASESLLPILNEICEELGMAETEGLIVKFLTHTVHMLERVIKKETLKYPKVNNFISENLKVYSIIDKKFNILNETYGIKVPPDEKAFVSEIFTNEMTE